MLHAILALCDLPPVAICPKPYNGSGARQSREPSFVGTAIERVAFSTRQTFAPPSMYIQRTIPVLGTRGSVAIARPEDGPLLTSSRMCGPSPHTRREQFHSID